MTEKDEEIYKDDTIKDITIIWAYSAKNRIVKPEPENSVLKPETSSLSPSERSKGARLVSASTTTMIMTSIIRLNIEIEENPENRLIHFVKSIGNKTRKKIATSYEILWAKARYPPSLLYILLDLHPTKQIGNTPIAKKIKKNRTPICSRKKKEFWITKNRSPANIKVKIGIIIKNSLFLCRGINHDFERSFRASAIGWRIPANLTLLGPRRNWI